MAMAIAVVGLVLVTSTKTGPLPQMAAGFHKMQMPAPRRGGEMLCLSLWYPAQDTAKISLIGQNALLYGFHGKLDGRSDGQAQGLVVLSHGSGGNALRPGWIASSLAQKGFVRGSALWVFPWAGRQRW